MKNLLTLAAAALIAYPLLLGALVAVVGGHRARRWFTGLTSKARSLVVFGLAGVLTGGIWLGPNVVATRLSAEPPKCAPTSPVHGPQSKPARDAVNLSAPTLPPQRRESGVLSGRAAPTAPHARRPALILYDGGRQDWWNRLTAQQAANLASHFGPWSVRPVSSYRAKELREYSAVMYFGSSEDSRIPASFLEDVLGSRVPVLWVDRNLKRLADHDPVVWSARYGFHTAGPSLHGVNQVSYRGTTLTRQDRHEDSGVRRVRIDDPRTARVVAEARRRGGGSSPWAVRAANLWYVGENPFAYTGTTDRYLAFSDLLFDVLAPATPVRHRSLVQLEGISPNSDPGRLRNIAACLHQARVPFSFGVTPVYSDPRGAEHDGKPTGFGLRDRPEVVDALKYMTDHGGTMVMHGVTRQPGGQDNPYNGVGGEDFAPSTAHRGKRQSVGAGSPTPGDSLERSLKRLDQDLAEFKAAGLPRPRIFEFPPYAARPGDYQAVGRRFGYRCDETTMYAGSPSGEVADPRKRADQFYPYGVRDVYGTAVIPENLGNVEAVGHNGRPPHGPADIIDAARRGLAVRDGVAGFFYHPSLGTGKLREIVRGLRGLGYDFVNPQDVMSPASR
jgi:uncharacterized protein YdaL